MTISVYWSSVPEESSSGVVVQASSLRQHALDRSKACLPSRRQIAASAGHHKSSCPLATECPTGQRRPVRLLAFGLRGCPCAALAHGAVCRHLQISRHRDHRDHRNVIAQINASWSAVMIPESAASKISHLHRARPPGMTGSDIAGSLRDSCTFLPNLQGQRRRRLKPTWPRDPRAVPASPSRSPGFSAPSSSWRFASRLDCPQQRQHCFTPRTPPFQPAAWRRPPCRRILWT